MTAAIAEMTPRIRVQLLGVLCQERTRSRLAVCVLFGTDSPILSVLFLIPRILVPLWPVATAILDRKRIYQVG
jgi:hypothetical protein